MLAGKLEDHNIMTRAFILCAIGVFAFCNQTMHAQATADQATLQSLLTEVRQLRLALEKAMAIGPRMQVTLERIRMQDEKVSRIGRELSDTRRELAGMLSGQSRTTEQAQSLEQRI